MMLLLETFVNYHVHVAKAEARKGLSKLQDQRTFLEFHQRLHLHGKVLTTAYPIKEAQPIEATAHVVIQFKAAHSRIAVDLHVTVIYPHSPLWLSFLIPFLSITYKA